MSSTGPKGPSDIPAMARVLQFRRPDPTTGPSGAGTVKDVKDVKDVAPTTTTSDDAVQVAAVFEHTPGQGTQVSAPVEGAALSQLIARLKSRGTDDVATVSGPTIVQTAEGKVLSGSLQIEGKAGMQKLDGVVRAGGDVAVGGILKNADLLAMRDLKVVEGRLTFESLRSKPPID